MIASLWDAIWPNIAAEPLCIIFAAVLAFIFRDRLGRHLAAWWHKHHGVHARADLAAMEKRLADAAEKRHLAIVKHLGKQSEHLVRQDNAMRDMKGAAAK
jgi:hypothetical protein